MLNQLKLQQGLPIEIKIKDRVISRDNFTIIAGPCTIENYDDLKEIALELKTLGISFLRGGAFKMRTSPYSFQGLGIIGLEYMQQVCQETGLISVSEIVSLEDIDIMVEYIDILQVGTRNMQNYRLLKKLGKTNKPILLKRGMSNTIEEWLFAAEHILAEGNSKVILCERGIRTFETQTRNTLDISAIPLIHNLSDLPVIVDPSHSSGRKDLIKPLSLAAAAVGAEGLMIETHFSPTETKCDSEQTITIQKFRELLEPLKQIISIWKKSLN